MSDKDASVRLYKFYGAHRALDNLEKRHLKVSTIHDLNDPFEFNLLSFTDPSNRKKWNRVRNRMADTFGLICFCRSWSNPVIWSHYADSHKGLALGFDVAENIAVPVKYRKTRIRLPSFERLSKDRSEAIMNKTFAAKFDHWSYEDEVRVFTALTAKDDQTGLYFKKFNSEMKLREVVIGANSEVSSNEVCSRLGNAESIAIKTARMAFRDFKIVQQKDSSLQK